MIVRADGNNFIAEIAAAASVVKAIPKGIPVTLLIDSMATIGALSQDVVSERKRVRAAGRAWLNWCRQDLLLKRSYISLQHITSHQEKKSVESHGNDQADAIANAFRQRGELSDPHPYFTLAEEQVVFQYNENIIQGDSRELLKSIEKEKLMEAWIAKTKVQSQWIWKHPTQILKQAKRVWDTSIHCGDGRAWVYFIFAICQWLPTNHCLYRKLPEGEAKIFCFLCLGRKTESVDHFFECPALGDEVHQLKVSVQRTLCESKFPLASLEVASWRENLICNWVSAASYLVSETLTRSKLQRIAWDSFMRAHKQFIGVRHFVERVALAVREQKQENAIPDHLAAVLVSCFNLGVEGSTDVLRRR